MNKTKMALLALCAAAALAFTACSSGGDGISYGSLSYQGQTYKTVEIGGKIWMAENLNYAVEGGKCYENEESNCGKYGMLYDWEAAMAACPVGWHLPLKEDWDALSAFIESDNGCARCDAKHLKAKKGWDFIGIPGNGLDTYGFAALPGSYGKSDGDFGDAGIIGFW